MTFAFLFWRNFSFKFWEHSNSQSKSCLPYRTSKRQIFGKLDLFSNRSYRCQQQQSPLALFRSKGVTAHPSISRCSYVLLPPFKIGKSNQNTSVPCTTSLSRSGNSPFSLPQPSVSLPNQVRWPDREIQGVLMDWTRTAHAAGVQHPICMANAPAVSLSRERSWPHLWDAGALLAWEGGKANCAFRRFCLFDFCKVK